MIRAIENRRLSSGAKHIGKPSNERVSVNTCCAHSLCLHKLAPATGGPGIRVGGRLAVSTRPFPAQTCTKKYAVDAPGLVRNKLPSTAGGEVREEGGASEATQS